LKSLLGVSAPGRFHDERLLIVINPLLQEVWSNLTTWVWDSQVQRRCPVLLSAPARWGLGFFHYAGMREFQVILVWSSGTGFRELNLQRHPVLLSEGDAVGG
jgi:hypothetical protein